MLRKQVLIAISVLIACCLGQNLLKIKLSESKGNCEKVLQKPDGPLQLTYARVLTLDDKGVIKKNVICTRNGVSGDHLKFKCEDSIEEDAKNVIMIAVTAKEKTMASQIEYRYKESTMNMFENGITDPKEVEKQAFEAKAHLSIQEIVLSPEYKLTFPTSCIHIETYPDNLIADHGLYVSGPLTQGIDKKPLVWTRTYFDPIGLGERLITS